MFAQLVLFALIIVFCGLMVWCCIHDYKSGRAESQKYFQDLHLFRQYVRSLIVGQSIANDKKFKKFFTLVKSKRSENDNWDLYGCYRTFDKSTVRTTPLGIITEINY